MQSRYDELGQQIDDKLAINTCNMLLKTSEMLIERAQIALNESKERKYA